MKPQRYNRHHDTVLAPSSVAKHEHKHVIANYVASPVSEYAGNEFIEALGPILTAKEMAASMSLWPKYDEAERLESAPLRKIHIERLNRIYVPLSQQHSIAQSLASMIREGYVHRSPSTPEFNRYLQESYNRRTVQGIIESAPDVAPICGSYAVIGVSGMGKSLLTRRVLSQYPRLIWHPSLRRYQIPYIVVECPHNGTVKQLILNFFSELDKVAYTSYEHRFQRQKMTVEELIREVNAAAHLFGIGVIVIDEIQHAYAVNGTVAAKLFMNFLVRFVNTSTAPVVLIGTMSSLKMLQSDFRQARRTIGALLTNYTLGEEWNTFVEGIWKYQWTRNVCPLDEDFSTVLYTLSQGIPALAVKLYQFAQRRAIESRSETLSVDIFKEVFQEEFTRVEPMVKALAEKDMSKLTNYGDITIPDFLNTKVKKDDDDDDHEDNAADGHGLSLAALFEQALSQ